MATELSPSHHIVQGRESFYVHFLSSNQEIYLVWTNMGGGLNFGSRGVLCSVRVCVAGQCLNHFRLIDQLKQASSSWNLGRRGGEGPVYPNPFRDWGNSVLTNQHQASVIQRRENRSRETTSKCTRVNSGCDDVTMLQPGAVCHTFSDASTTPVQTTSSAP